MVKVGGWRGHWKLERYVVVVCNTGDALDGVNFTIISSQVWPEAAKN